MSVITTITRAGTVILATVASFAVRPPVLNQEETSGIHLSNILTFVAGVISIIAAGAPKDKKQLKRRIIILVICLVGFLLAYEVVYSKYSVNCLDVARNIISYDPVKEKVAARFKYWVDHHETPRKAIVDAHNCSSTEVWEMRSLALPYYGLIAIYLAIIISSILLITAVSDLLSEKQE